MAALLVMFAALRPTAQAPVAQADIGSPGGITALPSAAPAVPGLANQGIPAIIGTGQSSIVAVFCAPPPGAALPGAAGPCSEVQESGPMVDGYGWISFKLTQVYPTPGGVPLATFESSGTDTAVVTDSAGADMDLQIGVVALAVKAAAATQGGTQGVNEIVKVTATDETGDARSVNIVIVDTMLAWGATGPISTASQAQPVFISYHCGVLGRAPVNLTTNIPASMVEAAVADGDGDQGLDDMYDGLYAFAGAALGYGTNTVTGDADIQDLWCGGNTASSMFDDFVDFSTDKGIFSVDPIAVPLSQAAFQLAIGASQFFPPILDYDCGEGKNIDTFDTDALTSWATFFYQNAQEGGCDLDGWRNGVVTTELNGTGEVGVATITAQQGGGVSPVRTINVTFTGEAAAGLFLAIDVPDLVGTTGADFKVTLIDQDGRPVGNQTVQCTVDPTGGALAILNQTGSTGAIGSGNDGKVTFKLIPTGASVIGGAKLTLTCMLDSDRSVKATKEVTLSSTPNVVAIDLVKGCNPEAATWPDGTKIDVVAAAVAPPEALDAIWKFDTATSTWKAFSPLPAAAAANDLASLNRLDAVFFCVNAAAKVSRPVI